MSESGRFDAAAATWDDDPTKLERARTAADAIRAVVELRRDTRLLEYGAGTGLLSQALARDVGSVIVTDPSEGMRAVLRSKVDQGLFGADAAVHDLDLDEDEPLEVQVDLVVTLMALHHTHDLARVLDGFARMVAPGGSVAIIDLEKEDGSFHGRPEFDGHDGFDRRALGMSLDQAGFGPTRFAPCFSIEKNDRVYGLFLATAQRL